MQEDQQKHSWRWGRLGRGCKRYILNKFIFMISFNHQILIFLMWTPNKILPPNWWIQNQALWAVMTEVYELLLRANSILELCNGNETEGAVDSAKLRQLIGTVGQEASHLLWPDQDQQPSDDPKWFREVQFLQQSWIIPDFQSRWVNGDAFEFYQNYFHPWHSVMTQRSLSKLAWEKFVTSLRYSAKLQGKSLSDLIPRTTIER